LINRAVKQILIFTLVFSMIFTGVIPGIVNNTVRAEETEAVSDEQEKNIIPEEEKTGEDTSEKEDEVNQEEENNLPEESEEENAEPSEKLTADIINLSLGGKGYSTTMAEAVEYAQDKGVLVVAAAGNEGEDASRYYPAGLPGVLTAGAVDRSGNIASFSNIGSRVDIFAPGVDIVSTSIKGSGTMGNDEKGYYEKANGTSFSSPYTAGVAAVYKIKNPDASAGQIIEVIKNSAVQGKKCIKLNMYNAVVLGESHESYIQFLTPKKDSYISDVVEIKARIIKNSDQIGKVGFYLDSVSDKNKIAEIENDGNKEIYEYEWNTEKVKEGKHNIIAVVYDTAGDIKNKVETSIYVINEVNSGLVLKVKDPRGNVAVNAQIQLYDKKTEDEKESYEEIWEGTTDDQGLVRIPNTIIDDMTKYYVLINGVFDFEGSPAGSTLFIYRREVEGPNTVEINGEGTVPVKFNINDKKGDTISEAQYYATAVDENGLKIGSTSSLNSKTYNSPTIYMDKGKYDLFAYSKTDNETYFLSEFGKNIDNSDKELIFDGKKTGSVSLDLNYPENIEVVNSYLYLYNKYTEASIGISADEEIAGKDILVSAGDYSYTTEIEIKVPGYDTNWVYVFDSLGDSKNIKENMDNKITLGGNIKLDVYELDKDTMKNYVEGIGGTFNESDIKYSERDGVKVYKIPRGYNMEYTKHRFTDENNNGLVAIYKGSLGEDSVNIYGNVQASSLEEVNPYYCITRLSDGYQPYNMAFNLFYQYAFWYIGNPALTVGEYDVDLILEKNPLAENGIKGHMIQNIYDEDVKVLKLKDEKGNVLKPYTWIYRLEKDEEGNSYWEQSYGLWCDRTGKDIGAIVIDSGTKLSEKKDGNMAVFYYTDEKTDKNVFIFRTFTTLDELEKNMTINIEDLQLVRFNPVDSKGHKLDAMDLSQSIIIENDNLAIPFSHNIDMLYTDGIYMEPGEYGFNGIYITPKDNGGKYNCYYLINTGVDITKDGKNNEVKLDGSNTAKINVEVDKGKYESIRGIQLLPFNKYQYSISEAQLQGNVFYVSAGIKYDDVKLVYVLGDPEDSSYLWNYFVDKDDWKGKEFKKGEEYTLNYGAKLNSSIKLNKNLINTGDSISGISSITDQYGNRISQVEVTSNPYWIMDSENTSDYNQVYTYLPNGKVSIVPYQFKDDVYGINHDDDSSFEIRHVNPHLKVYKLTEGKEQTVLNEAKEEYYNGFNESTKNMTLGEYRAELSLSTGPDGIISTGSKDGLFTIAKKEITPPTDDDDDNDNNDDNDSGKKESKDGSPSNTQTAENKEITSDQTSVELLNGEIKMEFDKGLLGEKAKVSASVIDEKNVSVPKAQDMEKLSLAGKIYKIDSSVNKFDNHISLTLKYDKEKVKDVNKLGIYRYDEKDKQWIYAGGKVSSDGTGITAEIENFGIYAVMEYEKTFKDIQNHWAKEDIEILASKHIVEGTGEDFLPNEKITRKEFAVLLSRALRVKGTDLDNSKFTDVSSDEWYAPYINGVYEAGIIKGTEENKFEPDKEITREQMITMIMRCYNNLTNSDYNEMMATSQLRFKDEETISEWAYQAAVIGNSLGIVKGKEGEVFAPKDTAARAEAITMIKRLLDLDLTK